MPLPHRRLALLHPPSLTQRGDFQRARRACACRPLSAIPFLVISRTYTGRLWGCVCSGGSRAYARRRTADIAAARRRATSGEIGRRIAVRVDQQERRGDRAYQRGRTLLFPAEEPLLEGARWQGDVGRLVAGERRDAQFAVARRTVPAYARQVRLALEWMRRQWAMQLRGPFSIRVVGEHPDLVTASTRPIDDGWPWRCGNRTMWL